MLLCSSISVSSPSQKKNLRNQSGIVYCWTIFLLPALKIHAAEGISEKDRMANCFSDELVLMLATFHVW